MAKAALLAGLAALAVPAAAHADAIDARVARVLKAIPLIDGHNDWAEALREREGGGRWSIDLRGGLDQRPQPYNTDIARLAQPCPVCRHPAAIELTGGPEQEGAGAYRTQSTN